MGARAAFNRAGAGDALIAAVLDGDFVSVQILLKKSNAGIDAPDDTGTPALVHALKNEYEDIALWLLHRGANRDLAGAGGETPLMVACDKLMSGVVEKLVTQGAALEARDGALQETALFKAIRAKHAWAACRLIEAGADAACTNRKGETPEDLAQVHLSAEDYGFVSAAIARQRAAAASARQAAEQKQTAARCTLQRDIAPLKPLCVHRRPHG